MANGVQKVPQGPFWPLGNIVVLTPSTPVRLTSLVDPTGVNNPNTASGTTSDEYTRRCNQIIIQGMKDSGTGLTNNTGNIYLILKGGTAAGGSDNRTDKGAIILTIPSGTTAVIAASPLNRNVFTPYNLFLDADNAGDAGQVTLVIQ